MCGEKRAALKRCCLSGLPAHLLLHLKRFEFDFDAMRKFKINDFFAFPMQLNLFPYTKEGLAAASSSSSSSSSPPAPEPELAAYEYRLSGILIHSGVADAGHYYSYVRAGSDGSWLELNDELVLPFDVSRIPQAAFGGSEQAQAAGAGGSSAASAQNAAAAASASSPASSAAPQPPSRQAARENMKNAYMLFYERCGRPASELAAAFTSDEQQPAQPLRHQQQQTQQQAQHGDESRAPSSNPPSTPSSPVSSSPSHRQEHRAQGAGLKAERSDGSSGASSGLRIQTGLPLSASSPPQSPLSVPPYASAGGQPANGGSEALSVRARAQQLWLRSFPSLPPVSSLPAALVSSIWQSNIGFLQDKQIFDFSFLSFLFNLCSRQPPGSLSAAAEADAQQLRVLTAQIATFFVFKVRRRPQQAAAAARQPLTLRPPPVVSRCCQVLVRSAENGSFYQWMELLRHVRRRQTLSALTARCLCC